ncbi:uncharacterized protein LOC112682443 [Sipha flava]|uniref:Uncharacterized protein LOC112682443 n=1 Tax=Sipha flava TaxID=143950 RepID=A0A8B8FED9_9HEMI|nr:uncharacterized protein LOC112682443 [Sipha flava]
MSSSESTTSDVEYLDHVHECLKYVPIYMKGAFSCSSLDDDDEYNECDDEDVKRILVEYNEPKSEDCEKAKFSPAYKEAMAAVILEKDFTSVNGVTDENYKDWDEALKDVSMVYPPLGISRVASRTLEDLELNNLTSELCTTIYAVSCGVDNNDNDNCDNNRLTHSSTAWELRKCLEGALYGQDTKDFIVAQPYCVANKNLDFGKPKMSHKAMNDSRKKVENWMRKYAQEEDTNTTIINS